MPVSKLLKFPIGSYLMVRLDYVLICGDELEAKIMRIIEMYTESERQRLYQELLNDPKGDLQPEAVVEITKDVWTPISHRLFMRDLYGLVKSENTLKRAVNSLIKKRFIRMQYNPKKKYEAPRYQINAERVQAEFDKLARLGKAGYQSLIPSNDDTIKNSYHQPLTPPEGQELTPSDTSRVSGIDPNSNKGNYEYKDTVEQERESSPNILDSTAIVSSDTAHALPSEDEYPLITFADCLNYLQEQGVAPRGEDAVQIMVQARTLYAHKHPRYEYRARPGLSEHPDDQWPSKQNEQVFTNDAPQGDTHATRVPTVPRADHPASLESDNHCAVGRHDDLPVVHPVGCGTPCQEGQAGRAQDGSVDKKDPAETLAQTPPTSTPAQSLPLPQAEQAALGAKQEPKPLIEPDMSGKWSHEKCVEYAEWCNQRRYTDKMHEEQLKAAHAIHKNDVGLTLEQFKQAYDERNDAWWKEHKGKLHVNDMKARGASGIDRVHEMLQRIEDTASRSRAQTPRVLVPAPSPNQPITNIRELVRQRELLRQQQAVGV